MDIAILQERLQQALPGVKSHMKMAPAHRELEFSGIRNKDFNPRLSAVLVLLYPDAPFAGSITQPLKVVFIRRSEYVGIHSGQIAFPGGRYEDADGDLLETAKREVEEEIGVARNSYTVIGQLTDLYVPPSNFLVRAYVAYAPQRPSYVLDEREVQDVIETDLSHFYNPGIIKTKEFLAHASLTSTNAPYYDLDGVTIWGATAMMMAELVDLISNN